MTAEVQGLLSRLSDRLNPILVREVQQALRGKAFVVTLSAALAAIVVTALVVAAEGRVSEGAGRDYFVVALVLLTPIALFLIPLQACLSMQQEVRGGAGEQLLLSRLTPARIVRGKLMAAMVQFCLFASVFGPLLAMTFLLRGVDVPTIVFFMVAAALCCLCASAVGIAVGALGRARLLTSFLLAALAVGLGLLSAALMSSLWFMVGEIGSEMRRGEFWLLTGAVVNVLALVLVLCGMIAHSLLTHPNENRSTAFRVFPVATLAMAVAWIVGAADVSDWIAAGRVVAVAFPAGLALFWLFAGTEEERLSPRTRGMVPRSRVLAWLATPFLPGGGRGALFVALTAALALAAGAGLELAARLLGYRSGSYIQPRWDEVAVVAGYCVAYAGLGRVVRQWLRPGAASTWVARLTVPALVIMGCLVPLFLELMMAGHVSTWSALHLTNPFWSIEQMHRSREWWVLIAAAGAAVLALCLPAMARGVREVLEASRERRGRDGA